MDMVSGLINSLKINSTLFVMMGIFVGTFVLSYVLFLRRLSSFLVEREKRTQGRSESVDHLNEELVELSSQLAEKKKQVQVDADKLFHEIKQRAVDEQNKILKSAKDKSQAELEAMRAELEVEYQNQSQKIKLEVPLIANEILGRLMSAGKRSAKSGDDSVRKVL